MTISEWKKDFKGYINELDILRDDYKSIVAYIDEVPERKIGHWIWVECVDGEGISANAWKCSECGEVHRDSYSFCPDCGADMRGEQND